MKLGIKLGFVLALGTAVAVPQRSEAQAFSPPLPADVFIHFNGLDWAWASPCRLGVLPSCVSGYVLVDGFRFATASEFAARPSYTAFLRPDGSVRCASGWFNTSPKYTHCDLVDAAGGLISSGPGNMGDHSGYFPGPDSEPVAETWVVRGQMSAVPEPGTIGLVGLGLGLVGIGGLRRRKAV